MLVGLPSAKSGPEIDLKTFYEYIPNLQSYVEAHKKTFELYNKKLCKQLNYNYWGEEWEFALSLAIYLTLKSVGRS